MVRYVKRLFGILLSAVLTFSLLSCSNNKTNEVPPIGETFEFPLSEKITLTFWTYIDTNLVKNYQTMAEHPIFQRMGERTNVYFEFLHPTKTSIEEEFQEYMNLVAAGTLPDVFTPKFYQYKGGIDVAIRDGVYIDLKDRIPVHMPNLDALMRENAQIGKLITSAEGNIGWIPSITGLKAEGTPPTMGMMIRQDRLEELQLDIPETLDDWYNTLKKLKVSGGISSPLTFGGYTEFGPTLPTFAFLSAFGVNADFYLGDDQKVHYAPIESGMQQYVNLLNKWYDEELLSLTIPDTFAEDRRNFYASDETAAFYGDYTQFAYYKEYALNPQYRLVGTPYPVQNKGEKVPIYGEQTPVSGSNIGSFFISPTNPYPNETMKYFDQFYTEDMMMESSYGILNEDYTLVDGKPVFTDKVLNYATEGPQYGIAHVTWKAAPLVQPLVDLQVYPDEAKDAVNNRWTNISFERMLPAKGNLFFTLEEQERFDELETNCWLTAIGQMNAFITGERPLSEWDNFVDEMYARGALDYLALKQVSYDRYLIN